MLFRSSLGAVDRMIETRNADDPDAAAVDAVRTALLATIRALRAKPRMDLASRLDNPAARTSRAMSRRVRELLEAQWDAHA